jgi:hypothetical protein
MEEAPMGWETLIWGLRKEDRWSTSLGEIIPRVGYLMDLQELECIFRAATGKALAAGCREGRLCCMSMMLFFF